MRIRSLFAVLGAALTFATVADAKSPVQVIPDDNDATVLVNKNINSGSTNEQWVLVLNTIDETLVGNVFDLTGKPPTFFFCNATFDDNFFDLSDLASENVSFVCQVASGCSALPCSVEWQPVNGGVAITLPGSFFLP